MFLWNECMYGGTFCACHNWTAIEQTWFLMCIDIEINSTANDLMCFPVYFSRFKSFQHTSFDICRCWYKFLMPIHMIPCPATTTNLWFCSHWLVFGLHMNATTFFSASSTSNKRFNSATKTFAVEFLWFVHFFPDWWTSKTWSLKRFVFFYFQCKPKKKHI